MKGSLRPPAVLVSEPVEDDPVLTFSSEFLTCSGRGVLDIMPDCERLTVGLGDPSIDIRDLLEASEVPVPSLRLFVLLVPMGELVGCGEDDPRSREGQPLVEVSWLLLRSGAAP